MLVSLKPLCGRSGEYSFALLLYLKDCFQLLIPTGLTSSVCKGVSSKIFRGGANEKKRPKNSTIKALPGEGGANGNKRPKNALLSSIYYICTMYENPGGQRPPTLLAADAHECMGTGKG